MAKGRVYVIGGAQVILPFRAGGGVLRPAEDAAGVRSALDEVAAEPPGSLVLITGEAAALDADAVRDFEDEGAHAILVIPTRLSDKSAGLERMRGMIIRSVGVDLIARSPSAAIGEEIRLGEEEEE
ncbi:MAG: V-type ATP synthase subunit F [Chlamydiota bacterium]